MFSDWSVCIDICWLIQIIVEIPPLFMVTFCLGDANNAESHQYWYV